MHFLHIDLQGFVLRNRAVLVSFDGLLKQKKTTQTSKAPDIICLTSWPIGVVMIARIGGIILQFTMETDMIVIM